VGILVGDGSFPREQSIEAAHRILSAVPPPSKGSALCLSAEGFEASQSLRRLFSRANSSTRGLFGSSVYSAYGALYRTGGRPMQGMVEGLGRPVHRRQSLRLAQGPLIHR